MSDQMTLERLKQQVAQLPLREQLKLIAEISERLSAEPLVSPSEENDHQQETTARMTHADAWIAECDRVADMWEGEFDSAADLRRIRDEEA